MRIDISAQDFCFPVRYSLHPRHLLKKAVYFGVYAYARYLLHAAVNALKIPFDSVKQALFAPVCRFHTAVKPRLIEEIKKLNSGGGYLVVKQYGRGYTQQGFSKMYRDFVKNVNERIRQEEKAPVKITGTCKTLRKDYSTSRQGQVASIESTGKRMGHADKKVTQKNYINTLTPQMRAQERERLKEMDKYIVPLKYETK